MPQVTKILFLSADPADAARLRLGEEIREIRERLQLSKLRNKFAIEERHCVRTSDLTQALFDVDPHIVHFSGHATSSGSLCLEDRLGRAQAVSGDALATVFALFSDRISCVVLNACYSEPQADAIVQKIRYVVGMKAAIEDSAAISFSVGFYRALANGKSVEEAFQFGTAEVGLSGVEYSSVPRLLTNPQLRERLTIVRARHDPGNRVTYVSVPSIPGRATIRVRENSPGPDAYALINPTAYGNIKELLDELFIEALTERFNPYSYGAEWILSSQSPNRMQVAAPLAWASGGGIQSILQLSPEWYDTGLKEVGILPGSRWEVEDFRWGRKYYGVVTNSETLCNTLLRKPKAIALVRNKLKSISINELDESKYAFKCVLRDWLDRGYSGQILTEVNPENIDDQLRRLPKI